MNTNTNILIETKNHTITNRWQGRIRPAAPPPLRAVGPWLNHSEHEMFMNLYVVKHIKISTKTSYNNHFIEP